MTRRSEEWLAEYSKRNVERVELARQWNGNVAKTVVQPLYPIVSLCRAAGIEEPQPEFRFHPKRQWRLDYAWPLRMLGLEIDGGIWTDGRHTRGSGRLKDMEKQSEAAILGYRLLYVTPQQVKDGTAMDRIRRALGA